MIEIIQTTDAALLATLNEEIQTLHHGFEPEIFKPYDRQAVTTFFQNTLANENAAAFLAKEHNAILGYVLLFKVNVNENPFQYPRRYLLLDQLLVLAQHRGKGIGKRLLDEVIAFAKTEKCRKIELNHWSRNTAARAFFNQHGFTYYNEKMWKEIS